MDCYSLRDESLGEKVYPECDEEEAVNRLWDDLMSICRIEDDGREAWETHTASLERKAARLNERGYKNFTTPLRTGPISGSIWSMARFLSAGIRNSPAGCPSAATFRLKKSFRPR
ncbi:aminopeptidase [Allobaculum sp. Allo2]|nr:aminopeptidase [Allobaculum sp. Allo2]